MSLPEKYCGYFSFDAARVGAARGCAGSVTYSAVPSRMIASASLERWTVIAGLAIRFSHPPRLRRPTEAEGPVDPHAVDAPRMRARGRPDRRDPVVPCASQALRG